MKCYDKELIINGKVVRSPEQQVYKNMKDIEELKEVIKPEYTTAEELTSSSVSVAIDDTNAPEGTTEGWLITQDGLKFKITGGNNTNLLLEFYANLKGPQGNDGEDGTDGITPNITAAASVDSQVGTPSVVVTKTGTDAAPTFTFAFHNLKGETGQSLIEVQVVATLPASGETGILYFVPSSDPVLQNTYEEYIWLNSGWEKLGEQNIDLTNYIQKSYTSGLVKNDGTIDTTQYAPLSDLPEPNVPLDGTEGYLTSMKFGNIKFKIQRSLYEHTILLKKNAIFRILFKIYNDTYDPFDSTTLRQAIENYGGNIMVSGGFTRLSKNYIAENIEVAGSTIYLNGYPTANNDTTLENIHIDTYWYSLDAITDTVKKIL